MDSLDEEMPAMSLHFFLEMSCEFIYKERLHNLEYRLHDFLSFKIFGRKNVQPNYLWYSNCTLFNCVLPPLRFTGRDLVFSVI